MRTWQAKWIWPYGHAVANAHVLFRRDVELAAAPRRVTLHVAAESFARVWVNGVEAHRTTSISYPGHHVYEVADVTGAFVPGRNRIAALVRYIGVPSGASCPQDPGFLCEFEFEDENGSCSLVGSDATWACHRLDAWLGQTRRSLWFNLDLIECCDLRRLPADWPMTDAPGEVPEAIREPGVRYVVLEPRRFPAIQVDECAGALRLLRVGWADDQSAMQPNPALAVSAEAVRDGQAIEGTVDGFTVIPPEAGQVAVVVLALDGYRRGYLRLTVEGSPDAIVDLSWHERLTDGRFDVRDTRVFTTDRFILTGRRETVESEDWICGRYLQLTFRNVRRPLTVAALRWCEAAYPLQRRTTFRSSDHRLEQIVELGIKAARLCMQDNIMDCPWRERRQWIGDVQRIALINHHVFGDRALVRGVLRQHARFQDVETGRLWVCLPLYEEFPEQSMEWLRAVVEYGDYTGDGTLLDEVIGTVARLHAWFLRHRDADGLFRLTTPPVMAWMDNPYSALRSYSGQTSFLALNLRYLLFLDDVALALRRSGRLAEARAARAERRALAVRMLPLFLESETGLLRDASSPVVPVTYSEMGHALAVLADLPGLASGELWDRFEAWHAAGHEVILPSPFGKYCTLEALGKLRRPAAVVAHILRAWGPMADAGSDTAWERFDDRSSLCHGWGGVPVVALMRHVLRLDPRKAGRRRAKAVAGVAWIEAEVSG